MGQIGLQPSAGNDELVPSSTHAITKDLDWLRTIFQFRIETYLKGEDKSLDELPAPSLKGGSFYEQLLTENELNLSERVTLLMALAVHFSPSIYDVFFIKDAHLEKGFTAFGGITKNTQNGFIPTGETVFFVLYGKNLNDRFKFLDLFSNQHFFYKKNVLSLTEVEEGDSLFNGCLSISKEYLSLLAQGKSYRPQYTSSFPAKRLTTDLFWEDAVYDDHTLEALEEVKVWIRNSDRIMREAHWRRFLKKGYRVLFYGPPGTGKTMTAALLGQECKMDVYQIDLSAVVSKYIGETEKNLARVFDMAENKRWMLFFDEADALFGSRTNVQSSNDQYMNQQIGYLLQRIEDYNGVVILATNFKDNIDSAFLRRFQSTIYFPKPALEQRRLLWEKYFASGFNLEKVSLEDLARDHEITGGSIINVLRYCIIQSIKQNSDLLNMDDVLYGINKEYSKDGLSV